MKYFSKHHKKNEKGQVLVLVGLMMITLVAVIGLAIDTGYLYVSYARLQRAVDAAALAGTGEFKLSATRDANIAAAAKQMFALNGVKLDPAAGFTDPMTSTVGMSIETCDNTPGDEVLCDTPLQKIIRVTAQEQVPMFFLSVIGFTSVPIKISTVATAASADVMLTLDTSTSMTYDAPSGTVMRDPNACNPSSCHPMEEVKAAAKALVDQLYLPYDRVGIAYFDQNAFVDLALSTDATQIKTHIDALEVYEGETSMVFDTVTNTLVEHGTTCIYYRDDNRIDWNNRFSAGNVSPPRASPPNTMEYGPEPGHYDGPCRMKINDTEGAAPRFSCPANFGPDHDPSLCGQSNVAGGVNVSTRALLGTYDPSYTTTAIPVMREDSIWVILVLSDFVANVGFSPNGNDIKGNAICPASTITNDRPCVDLDASVTHAFGSADYDVDDQARDMFKSAKNNNIIIYNVGLGDAVYEVGGDRVGPAPGQTLMEYPKKTLGVGEFFFAPNGSALTPIFQAIANLITSRINQ